MENLTQAIHHRYSCRTFSPRPVDPPVLEELERYIDGHRAGLENAALHLKLIQKKPAQAKRMKVNYGAIKNHNTYVMGAAGTSVRSRMNYGFVLEKITLKATALGLASCWIGYFDAGYFPEIMPDDGEDIPGILVIGYAATRKGLADRLMSGMVQARRRKEWDTLFFHDDFLHPLSRESAGPYGHALDMLRLAPSAGNTQPWRVVMTDDGGRFHFYKQPVNQAYEKRGLHDIDLGIAMAHFDLVSREKGLRGEWMFPATPPVPAAEGTAYAASWRSSS